MGFFETVVLLILILPVSFFIGTVFILAALGKSLGFRKKYVEFLLYIFEYGKKRIEKAQKANTDSEQLQQELEDSDGSVDWEDDNSNRKDRKKVIHEEKETTSVFEETKRRLSFSDTSLIRAPRSRNPSSISVSEHGILSEDRPDFEFSDVFEFVQSGIEAIVQDQVTQRFVAEELRSWNLLTRTNRHYEFISWRLSLIWVVGFFLRYCIMLPFRVLICFVGVVCLTIATAIVGVIPSSYIRLRRRLYNTVCIQAFGILSWSISAVISYHDVENRPGGWYIDTDGNLQKRGTGGGGICVANHTSPIDVLVLACDNTYAMIGQVHGGFLGILQRALARASSHIWFERSEMKDREAVAKRLREHVEDSTKLPILIFPEGTCINNSAVMQFKKGSFEVGGVIYPVAIKYDPRFGDPFWNSHDYSMLQYLYMMMTSWAIVCDVWYLPPMTRLPGESSVDFANRVKAEIARKGGLVDLDWDGQLKRAPAKREWKEKEQLKFAKKFAHSPRHIVPTDTKHDSPNPST